MMAWMSTKLKLFLLILLLTVIIIGYRSQSLVEISVERGNVAAQHSIPAVVKRYPEFIRPEPSDKVETVKEISGNLETNDNVFDAKHREINDVSTNVKSEALGVASNNGHTEKPVLQGTKNVVNVSNVTAYPLKQIYRDTSRSISNSNHDPATKVPSPSRSTSSNSPNNPKPITAKNLIWIDPDGSFLQRVEGYNDAITKLRQDILERRQYKPWQDIQQSLLDVLWCNRDDFMDVLTNYTHVTTVLLRWRGSSKAWSSLSDPANILVRKYYTWTATDPLCTWIKRRGFTNARWDAVYNRTCETDFDLSSEPISIEPLYFHGKPINVRDYWPNDGFSYPEYFYNTYPDYILYMHIMEDAIILETGDVISNNLKLVPYACSQDTDARPPLFYDQTTIYSEVFLISQFWGAEFFHSMIEGIPRLAPYIKFLQDNPTVLIHVVSPKPYIKNTLRFLGLNPERLIHKVARAKLLYVPQATPCGFAQMNSLQLLSHLYTNKLQQLHDISHQSKLNSSEMEYQSQEVNKTTSSSGSDNTKQTVLNQASNNNISETNDRIKIIAPRNVDQTSYETAEAQSTQEDLKHPTPPPSSFNTLGTVVLIRRSGDRRFRDNHGVLETVARAAQDFGFKFSVFRDDPSPPMEEAMALFYSAALVVAPHGAGLSNVVYSRPGVYVIEGVCNEPHLNMCYQWTSHILGHRYHAIPSRQGCEGYIDIEPAIIDLAVRTFLQRISQTQIL